MFNKKGVSLITVLLFMLVATIAATATFKWLTSENRSSASRMVMQESYQSALAGIQNTRAWMTNNAYEVGDVIRQYFLPANTLSTGKRKPIKLNNRISSLNSAKQNYNVWLTGVSETGGYYKLKILSEGIARDNARHIEAAILNVRGLYQVEIPKEEEEIAKVMDYDYTYFGGSVRNNGEVKISSMLINGNWHGNPVTVDKNIVITGVARLSGSNINILGTGCFGGDLYSKNGIDAKNIYVYGTSYYMGKKNLGIYNHAYFDGKVELDQNKPLEVGGNLTANNVIKTRVDNAAVTINGNLCLGTGAQVQIGSSVSKDFKVQGDVWITQPNSFYTSSGDFHENYGRIILGNNASSKVYITDAYPSSDYATLRSDFPNAFVNVTPSSDMYYFYVPPSNPSAIQTGSNYQYNDGQNKRSPYCKKSDNPSCHVTPWFKSKGTVSRNMNQEPRPVACADSVKQVCDAIWDKEPGCKEDGFPQAHFKVKDILTTAYDKFEPYSRVGCAKKITSIGNSFVSTLNDCYTKSSTPANSKTDLYNGYLVVKVRATEKIDHTQDLKGKFIIIIENKPAYGREIVLPATAGAKDFVFLYLTEGANKIQGVDNKTYNYFIYTPKDIGTSKITTDNYEGVNIQPEVDGFLFNNGNFHGSIYAVAKNCAKISSITNKKPMVFNQELLNSLNESRIICPAAYEGKCGGVATSSSSGPAMSSSSGSGIPGSSGVDPYFMAIAPQLNVTLESQYKAAPEEIQAIGDSNNEATLAKSLLVTPRVIYLTKDARGTLADYYSVLTLNKDKNTPNEVKTPSKANCGGSFPTTGKLFNGTDSLSPGLYTCNYTTDGYDPVPFYVIVGNASGEQPKINFIGSTPAEMGERSLNLSDEGTISVHIEKSESPGEKIRFDVAVRDDGLAGWNITPLAGVSERGSGSGMRYYTVEVTSKVTAQDVHILRINTEANADDGDMYFFLRTPTERCKLGDVNENNYHVYVRAHVTINRESLTQYCSNFECDENMREKSERPDCDYVEEWVTINGSSCTENYPNYSWTCLTNSPISLAAINTDAIPAECEIIIPSSNNTITNPVGGDSYSLYGSLKRKRVEVNVDIKNAINNYSNVRIIEQASSYYSLDATCTKENSPCSYRVLAGMPVNFVHGDYGEDEGNFSYWKVCKGDGCDNQTTSKENEITLSFSDDGPHKVIAEYNKESHCYYDDFTNTYAFCTANDTNCVDTCATAISETQACLPPNSKQIKSYWLMAYHNKGSEYIRPNFGDGFIYASVAQNKPSIILRNKGVGANGTMFALVQTGIVENDNTKDFLNSGLVFRSNGNKHLILNIFGATKPGNSGELTFRVCKVEGQSIINATQGDCKKVRAKPKSRPITITNSSFIKVRLVIENNLLKVTAKVDNETWEGELNELDFNDELYKYVGLSLADPDFKVYDNGWSSSGLNESCWEIPTITCNFDGYGRFVPLNEYVTPFVTLSTTWFDDKNCIKEFYYNGCDNATSSCVNGTEEPGEIGSKLNGNQYYFTQDGPHGMVYDEKITKYASLKMVCPGDAGSLDLAQDYYGCGYFKVGEDIDCSSDIEIFKDDEYNAFWNAYETKEFPIPDNDWFNMHKAELHVNINSGLLQADLRNHLTVQLQDINGMMSLSRTLTENHIPVENFTTNTIGFNPQKVTKVIIKSDQGINVQNLHIRSNCTEKVALDCENTKATYDIAKQGWVIDVSPSQTTDVKCSYAPNGSSSNIESKENVIGCKNVVLKYKNNNGVYNSWLFDDPPTFTVTATKNNNSTTCSDIKGTKPGNNIINCHVETDNITNGTNAPNFYFTYGANAVGLGNIFINYKVTLDNTTIKTDSTKFGTEKMVSTTIKPEVGQHTYKVEFNYNFALWTQSCEADFAVGKAPMSVICPNDINNQNPDNLIDISSKVTVKNCEGCTYDILYGSTKKNENNELFFYDAGATGKRQYTLKATDNENNSKTCPFNVTFVKVPETEMRLSCTYNPNNDAKIIPAGQVLISCWDEGYCVAHSLHCCPANDCYNGSVDPGWKVNGKVQNNSKPKLGTRFALCSNQKSILIESKGDLRCAIANESYTQ